MTFTIAVAPGGSRLTLRYVVGGYRTGGLGTLAGPVDAMLGEQVARLKAAAERR